MAIVSRLELNHPALGTAGGSALHTSIEDIYVKLGDSISSRFFQVKDLNAAGTADLDHNYNTSIDNIKFDVYSWNEGTGELTYLTELTTPKRSEIAIIAKVGDTLKQATITNNSAGQVDLGFVMSQEVIKLSENDIKDIDIVSVAPEDGQSLVYESSSEKFKPGASGDSSFKFQKLTGTVLTIKKGYMGLSDGSEIYSSVDLTPDLATFIPGANADYYGYFDRYLFPDYTTVNGRKLIAMTTAQLVFSTTTPDLIGLSRYVAIGKVQKAAGVFTNIETLAIRKHDVALGADSSLVDSLEYTLIGAVGDASQLNSGHQLAASSFPAAAIGANLSWWNGNSVSDASGNARTLTNNGGVTLVTGILGDANQAFGFNGINQSLSSTLAFFDPGNADFCVGGWFKPNSWIGAQALVSQWNVTQPNSKSWHMRLSYGGGEFAQLQMLVSFDGTNFNDAITMQILASAPPTGWHHIVARYIASTKTMALFFDGVKVTEKSFASNIWSSATDTFVFSGFNDGSSLFAGSMDELFFSLYAKSDNDIMKLQAAKYTHNKGMASNSQDWRWWIKTVTDAQRRLDYDPIISAELNELFFDLSQEATTALISRKLFNAGQTGLAKPLRGQTLALTTDQLDAILPITHNCGAVPCYSLLVYNGTDYEAGNETALVVNATQIKIADGSLVSLYGTGVNCILTYSSSIPSSFVPDRFWNPRQVSAAFAFSRNDRVFVDTTGSAFAASFPASPSVNDEFQWIDQKNNFAVNKFTLTYNSTDKINGLTTSYDSEVPGFYKAIYTGSTFGWAVIRNEFG